MICLDSCHKAGPSRELPRRKPAHVAERQLEAVPDKPEEQHVDTILQVFPHRSWR